MCRASRTLFFLVSFVIGGWLMIAPAWAHRDRGPDDPCRKQIGDSLLHLTLYQPHLDPDAEYCEEVPRAGRTVVVVDVTAGELRQVPISVEMFANGPTGQSRSVLSIPAKILDRGVVDAEVIFDEGNNYSAQVVVDMGKEVHKFSFPILVTPWYTALIKPVLLLIGLAVVTTISVIRYRMNSRRQQREESSVGKRRVRRVAN
jgi:hypothetical protein